MVVEKNRDGSYTVSTMFDGYRVHERYLGYTKREVIRKFRQKLNGLKLTITKNINENNNTN